MTCRANGQTPAKAVLATRKMSLLEIIRKTRRNVIEIIPELATRQPMVSGKTVRRWHIVMDPTGLRRILQDQPESYPKAKLLSTMLRPAIGNSLFVAEGKEWLWQRRAAAGAFHTRSIRGLAPVMAEAAKRLADRISQSSPGIIDICDEMTVATYEVISDVAFSDGRGVNRRDVLEAIEKFTARAGRVSPLDVINAPTWIPRFGRLVSDTAVRRMKSITMDVIDNRRRSEIQLDDLHGLLAEGFDPETGRYMNKVELRDNLLTFIVAGHETTTLALAWSLYLLAFDQNAQNAVREEANSVLQGRIAEADDLANLSFSRQVIQEALRLYPPAGMLLRTALKADEIGGREVRPGDTMMLAIYALHRNHCYWKRPDHFEPTRFSDPKTAHSYTYLPFGGGRRMCIGFGFAMQEALIFLTAVMSRFRFELSDETDAYPVMILTLRPRSGLRLKVTPC